jgi:hypothetical protein
VGRRLAPEGGGVGAAQLIGQAGGEAPNPAGRRYGTPTRDPVVAPEELDHAAAARHNDPRQDGRGDAHRSDPATVQKRPLGSSRHAESPTRAMR